MIITVALQILLLSGNRKKTEVKAAALTRKEVAVIAIIVLRSAISMIRVKFNLGITVVVAIRDGIIGTKRAAET